MLKLLHEKINTIIAINGISQNEDDSYRIDYIDEPNQNQLDEINNIINSWPLESAKIIKIQELNRIWEQSLSNGWTTPYGWKLGLTTNDLVLLNGNFALAKEALANNIPHDIFIIDMNNEAHQFNIQDLTMLMLQYGQARVNLSSSYSSKLNSIKNAQSIEELDNINIIFT